MGPTVTPASAKALWYRALAQEFGTELRVATEDMKRVELMLYKAREDANDPRLQSISIAKPARYPGAFWFVKKAVKLDASTID